jgi:hypothetical protein
MAVEMPYALLKVSGGYSVVNTASGKIHSKHTTLPKAEAQLRLLRGVEHGFHPTGKKARRDSGTGSESEAEEMRKPRLAKKKSNM